MAVTPWVDRTRDEPLVAEAPTPGKVVAEETIEELGAVRWTLSNGAQVLLKPTDFKNDEILIGGYSPGGRSLVEDADYFSATQAATIVGQMGLGSFDRIELGKALTGKVAGARAFIGELSEGISGSASPKDVETLFQLLYLRFTSVRCDPEAFQAHTTTTRGWLERSRETALEQNRFWLGQLAFFERHGFPLTDILEYERIVEAVTRESLHRVAQRYLDLDNYLLGVLYPEGSAEEDAPEQAPAEPPAR